MKGDRELCMAAVAKTGLQLEFVSEEMKSDRELCMAAVAQDWKALQWASEEMKGDRELCTAAVAQDWQALQHASVGRRRLRRREITWYRRSVRHQCSSN